MVQALQKAYRSANKERKSRKATETGPVQAKASMVDSGVVKARRMQFMEDEDEVIEMKSIAGGRRDSKKTIPALIVSRMHAHTHVYGHAVLVSDSHSVA